MVIFVAETAADDLLALGFKPITIAILGAKLGEEALPDFYLESLEPIKALRELAEDLAVGSPAKGLFDDSWDHKYTHGLPLK